MVWCLHLYFGLKAAFELKGNPFIKAFMYFLSVKLQSRRGSSEFHD